MHLGGLDMGLTKYKLGDLIQESFRTKDFKTLMTNLDEVHEGQLEAAISKALIEKYEQVAGYRLNSCEYLNESFNVHGTVYFTSGKSEKVTQQFSSARQIVGSNKILIEGLDNLKLLGRVKNKILFTESVR